MTSPPPIEMGQQKQQTELEPERVSTLFSELPMELQIIIFEFALPGPRVVEFRFLEPYRFAADAQLRQMLGVPPLLHTCQLSRKIVLESLSLFQDENGPLPLGYFNFKLDSLCLTLRSINPGRSLGWGDALAVFTTHVKEEQRNKVRHLIEDSYPFNNRPWLAERLLPYFRHLKTLAFLFDRQRCFMNDDGSFKLSALDWIPPELRKMKLENPHWKEPNVLYELRAE